MATHFHTTPLGVHEPGLPIGMQEVIARLTMHPEQTEVFLAGLANALIEEQDRLEPDPDLEPSFGYLPDGAAADECELDADDLTAPERYGNGFVRCGPDDAEEDDGQDHGVDDLRHDPDPDEPSLGSLDRHMDQTDWARMPGWSYMADNELDRSDYEPSLGSSGRTDQRLWATGDRQDRELVDEDGCDMQGSDNGIADCDGVADQWGCPVGGYYAA